MAEDTYARLLELLDAGGARYRLIEHAPEGRTDAVSALRGNALEAAAKCLVLMLKLDKKTRRHVLAVIPGDRRVDLEAVKRLYGATYAAFTDQETAERLAGSVAGTVLPFSFDPDLELVVDEAVLTVPTLFFNAARLDRSLALDTADYRRLAAPHVAAIARPIEVATEPAAAADGAAAAGFDIVMDVQFPPGTRIDVATVAAAHPVGWTNRTLAQVNESLVRVGVFEGEFPWHVHALEDEFFLVLEGRIFLDVEGREPVSLDRHCAFLVPAGVGHRPRAPERAVVLMVERAGVSATGG